MSMSMTTNTSTSRGWSGVPADSPAPLIGITVGRDLPDHPAYVRQRSTYAEAIAAAGGLDVDPSRYGESPHAETRVDEVLDRVELEAARWAVDHPELATLGICRGQQLLNVALGGSLIQHLPDEVQGGHPRSTPRTQLRHTLRLAPDSRLAEIMGTTELEVNSLHHQAVRALGRGLRPVGWSAEGLVEAVESAEHPWLLAVQFHPEDLVPNHAPSQRLIQAFVSACTGA